MKLLLDMGLASRTADYLCAVGHEADHVRRRGMSRNSDEQILTLAASEGRVVVTCDLEFSRILAIQRLVQPSVVLFRLERFTTDDINTTLCDLLARYQAELMRGAVIVVDSHRVRIRTLPIW